MSKKETKGKPSLWEVLSAFNLALESVATRAALGHEKYKDTDEHWDNFKTVPGSPIAYLNGNLRHTLGLSVSDEDAEDALESMIEDMTATAWNSLAALQTVLEVTQGQKRNPHYEEVRKLIFKLSKASNNGK